MDKTAEFRQEAVQISIREGRKPPSLQQPHKQRNAFHRAAGAVHLAIVQALAFVHRCQDAADEASSRAEQEARVVLKRCGQQVDELQQFLADGAEQAEDDAQQQWRAHVRGVLACLYGRLEDVSGAFACARALRSRNRPALSGALWAHAHVRTDASLPTSAAAPQQREGPQQPQHPQRVPDAGALELETENRLLASELRTMGDEVAETERRLRAVAELQDLFASRVLQQASDIDALHDAAVTATVHVTRGGEHLRKAAERSADFRAVVVAVMLMASFSLLFLHWYSP